MTAPAEDFVAAVKTPSKREVLGKLAELLDRSGIDVDEIGRVHRINAWQGFYKTPEGDAEKVDLVGIQLTPKWDEGPSWPVIQPAPNVTVKPLKVLRKDTVLQTACIAPDIQVGFRQLRDDDGELYLDPFHDEIAIAAFLAVVRSTRPELVVFLGDCLDFAAQSRFVQEPSWALTTQDAINRFHELLCQVRALVPEARIVVLEGNHDLRLPKAIMVNAAASFGLQRANLPASWPVLTVPHLCRFDDLNVEYVPGYPSGEFWINDNLVAIHGHKVRSAGSTASAVIDDERVSTIFGHVHRIELMHKTRRVKDGCKQSFAASPGCLCRIDGAVPGVKGGIDMLGRPITSFENWQQGMAVVTFEEGNGRFDLELVPIYGSQVMFRGKMLEAV